MADKSRRCLPCVSPVSRSQSRLAEHQYHPLPLFRRHGNIVAVFVKLPEQLQGVLLDGVRHRGRLLIRHGAAVAVIQAQQVRVDAAQTPQSVVQLLLIGEDGADIVESALSGVLPRLQQGVDGTDNLP
jgi:hypothetical protein